MDVNTLNMVAAIRGGNTTTADAAAILDAWLDARLEQAMPKILGAIRGGMPDRCGCGHDKTLHICYAGDCCEAKCGCKRFLSEQPKS